MLPKINGVGVLTRDPEQRFTQNGTSIVSFTLAFNEKYKDQESVNFIDCTVFGALGDKVIIPYVHKGDKLYIAGKLNLDTWKAQDGSNRQKHSITVDGVQLIGSNNSKTNKPTQNGGNQQTSPQNAPEPSNNQPMPDIDIDEDEIPF